MLEKLNKDLDQSGQITIFLTLIFFVMLGAVFLVIGGMREYLKASLIQDGMSVAMEDILTQYDKVLMERYHLFFLDPREEDRILEDAADSINRSFSEDGFFDGIQAEFQSGKEVKAMDSKGKAVLSQIKEWELKRGAYKIPAVVNQLLNTNDSNQVNQSLTESQGGGDGETEDKDSENNSENDSDKEENTVEKMKIRQTWKAWKEAMESVFRGGILTYVMENPGKVSKLYLPQSSKLPSSDLGKGFHFFDIDSISLTGFSNINQYLNQDSDEKNSLLTSDIYLLPYIFECYSSYEKELDQKKHCLKYEIEYLIAGKSKDQDNLKSIANQIFLLRFIGNCSYAFTDGIISTEAKSMALALTGFLGFPEAADSVAKLLVATLCYEESLLEVRALFHGKKVALVKNTQNWNLTFTNAPGKLAAKSDTIPVAKGVGYEDYLRILLIKKSTNRRLLYRMMDLMQTNVALEEPGFLMKDCIYSLKCQGSFSWQPFFSNIPAMGLSWKNLFEMKLTRTVTYH